MPGEEPRPGVAAVVTPDGNTREVAGNLWFPIGVESQEFPQGWRHAIPHGVRYCRLVRGGLLVARRHASGAFPGAVARSVHEEDVTVVDEAVEQ
jgi:hypothetical protein